MKLISIFLLTCVASVLGAETKYSLNELQSLSLEELMNITIVSSTGTQKNLAQAPAVASVITAQQIERSSARTLSEVLEMVPGLHIFTSSLESQKKNIDIRGIQSAFNSEILMLMNGVSIDRLHTGSATNLLLPASNILRIEVVRGPGSAIYGADAFSGVINIITKDAKYLENNSQVGTRYGSFNSLEVYSNVAQVFDNDFSYALNLSYMQSEGDTNRIINADLQTTFDTIFSTSASQAPSSFNKSYEVYDIHLSSEYKNFYVNLWTNINKNTATGAGIANALDSQGGADSINFLSDIGYTRNIAKSVEWKNSVSFFYNEQKNRFTIFPAGATIAIGDDGNAFSPGGGIVNFTDGYIGNPNIFEQKTALESTLLISSFDEHLIRVSVGYSYTDYRVEERKNFGPSVINGTEGVVDGTLSDVSNTPYAFMPDVYRSLYFVSLQDEYEFLPTWTLTAGVRYDSYSDVGDTINPRVALVNQTTSTLVTKLLYGRAFRAPTAPELYARNNPAGVGNSEVKPETIDMIELGFTYIPSSSLKYGLNFYAYSASDLIQGVASNVGVEFNNVAKLHGAGVESELSYQASETLLLSADYAYRWTQNQETKESALNVPKHLAHAMFDWSIIKNIYCNSEVYYVADIAREVGDTREKVEDYALVNISMGYRVYKGVELSLAVRNLFDTKYYDPSNSNPVGDYPMEGLNIFGEIRYRF